MMMSFVHIFRILSKNSIRTIPANLFRDLNGLIEMYVH